MTRKNIAITIISFSIIALFLNLLVGPRGVTYLCTIKKEVKSLEREKAELQSKVESLSIEKENLSQGEGVNDAAFKLGYQKEGEQVYYFPNQEQEKQSDDAILDSSVEEGGKGNYFQLPQWLIMVISLVISLVIMLWCRHRDKKA